MPATSSEIAAMLEQLAVVFDRPPKWDDVLSLNCKVLRDLTSDQLLRALDSLLAGRMTQRFPRPAEIRAAAGSRDPDPTAPLPGSVLPLGWEPSSPDRYYARLCKLDIERTAVDFKAAWWGRIAQFTDNDWSKAWREWCKQQIRANPMLEAAQ